MRLLYYVIYRPHMWISRGVTDSEACLAAIAVTACIASMRLPFESQPAGIRPLYHSAPGQSSFDGASSKRSAATTSRTTALRRNLRQWPDVKFISNTICSIVVRVGCCGSLCLLSFRMIRCSDVEGSNGLMRRRPFKNSMISSRSSRFSTLV